MSIVCETGWSEDFVLWHLPMRRAWGYYHCACQRNGVEVESYDAKEKRRQRLEETRERLTRMAKRSHGRKI